MMRAREEGWRCLMSSQESNSSDVGYIIWEMNF